MDQIESDREKRNEGKQKTREIRAYSIWLMMRMITNANEGKENGWVRKRRKEGAVRGMIDHHSNRKLALLKRDEWISTNHLYVSSCAHFLECNHWCRERSNLHDPNRRENLEERSSLGPLSNLRYKPFHFALSFTFPGNFQVVNSRITARIWVSFCTKRDGWNDLTTLLFTHKTLLIRGHGGARVGEEERETVTTVNDCRW